ncbi:hypothetical protein GW17_00024011 [Ensete ventricosum]|nr:hypothetical protein GW17_00024011 [Ensete ventricosum]
MRRRPDQQELSYPRPPSPPLNSTRTKIFLQIKEKGLLRTPNPLKGPRELWDRAKYCQFYRDYGHDMEDCHDLYNQIEELIHREYLVHYPKISFQAGEAEFSDHDNALVISVCVGNALVKRVMVDTGSLADILYNDAFQKLTLTMANRSLMSSTLTTFTGDSIAPLRTIIHPITLGQEP